MIIAAQQRLLTLSCGSQINVVPTPLRRDDANSPWCYTYSVSPIIVDDEVRSSTLPPRTNFLATQVWPSSRLAATVLEQYLDPSWKVCEFGCGPALPSLTAAMKGAEVIATDLDECALEMAEAAAREQGYMDGQRFQTLQFDLTLRENNIPPDADLYIMSDVFESSNVASSAAFHVQSILNKNSDSQSKRRVWVFAQSDRAQRETFLDAMRETYNETLEWSSLRQAPDMDSELWLCDLDETAIKYN
mmetsp:Transcript_16430/g.23280  ORF Transcript_16430/g.23280 Transcript_16430/m.23280 type:complete len:246 (+) Transcript_16430:126-863(+)|eukprot:CAMPEP_0201701546 /NCGR_PEP_ID=MMETSP0578-20130828/33061_1 /ASSEMBLY_ACC=CAM_ASM_000663 /TAXON_ID=267565 /ORGANISM="Skeletonema grethea, Strain CCMP 1804" /LENGTH=245 /DNA_ID=CAMNT_0048188891 /DNA_START=96 /DNA_END=833 /DNA_ORIENTATION=-